MAEHGPDFLPPNDMVPGSTIPEAAGDGSASRPPGTSRPTATATPDAATGPATPDKQATSVLLKPLDRRPTPPRRGLMRRLLVAALALALVVALGAAVRRHHSSVSSQDAPASPTPTERPAPLPMSWKLTTDDLRVSGGDINDRVDGTWGPSLIDAGKSLVVLVSPRSDDSSAFRDQTLVALNPATGRVVWKQDLANAGMCATTLLDSHLVCLEPVVTDRATGLGVRWDVQERRPDTGDVVRSTEVNGWFCAVHVTGERIVLLEQQLPAPHAAIRALTPTLQQAWRIDLRTAANQPLLFTTWHDHDPYPAGPVLATPTFHDLVRGVLAMTAGSGTVFVDPTSGHQLGFPRCSDPQAGGGNIWCNEEGGTLLAVAYAVSRNALVVRARVPDVLLLEQASTGSAVAPPTFVDHWYNIVGVNLTTGRRTGRTLQIFPPGSVLGVSPPTVRQEDGLTLAITGRHATPGVTAFDPQSLTQRWHSDVREATAGLVTWRGKLLGYNDGWDMRAYDPATGAVVGHFALDDAMGRDAAHLVQVHGVPLVVGYVTLGRPAP